MTFASLSRNSRDPCAQAFNKLYDFIAEFYGFRVINRNKPFAGPHYPCGKSIIEDK